MPPAAIPFMITICGLKELAGQADRKVSHVISIFDPGQPEPEAFSAYDQHARLELKFHDIIEERPGFKAPLAEHVDKILEFGRNLLGAPEDERHLLVHCHGGISRSTASMILVLAQAQPNVPASDVLAHVLRIRDKAWPNLRILELGERQLGRQGEFTRAVGEVYRYQLERCPELLDLFLNSGRGREIQLALSKTPKWKYLLPGESARLASGNRAFFSWFLAVVPFFLAATGAILFLISGEKSYISDRKTEMVLSRVTNGREGLPVSSSLRGGDMAADNMPGTAIAAIKTEAAPVTWPREASSAADFSKESAQSPPEAGNRQPNQATGGRTARLTPEGQDATQPMPWQPNLARDGREAYGESSGDSDTYQECMGQKTRAACNSSQGACTLFLSDVGQKQAKESCLQTTTAAAPDTESSEPAAAAAPSIGDRGHLPEPEYQKGPAYKWKIYRNVRFGYTLTFPADIFNELGKSANGDGVEFASRDGRAKLKVFAAYNTDNIGLVQYRAVVLRGYDKVQYRPMGQSWFVLSGARDAGIFYQKVHFTCGGRIINAFELNYPMEQKREYDGIVTRMEKNFHIAPGSACNAAKR